LLRGAGMNRGWAVVETTEQYAVVPEAAHPDSKKLLAFWASRPKDGIVMGRDVPSRAIASLLAYVMVWEPVEDGRDMRVRLAGDALHRRFQGDLRGRLMSELFSPAYRAGHLENARNAIVTGGPVIVDTHTNYGNIEKLHAEVVLLPMLSPDRSVRWVLTGSFYYN
jgi:hypothetical protein